MKNSELNKLKRRILEISYPRKLSHLGSCLTALPIIVEIYEKKKKDEHFVLSAGHAHLAHAVVMEYYGDIENAEENIDRYGIHCDTAGGCSVSSGSLGHGLGVAVGMALSDRSKNVYCLISDGECSEGSIWEAIRIAHEQVLENVKIYLNYNSWGAYKQILLYPIPFEYKHLIETKLTNSDQFPFLKGQDAHYYVMQEADYNLAMEILE